MLELQWPRPEMEPTSSSDVTRLQVTSPALALIRDIDIKVCEVQGPSELVVEQVCQFYVSFSNFV